MPRLHWKLILAVFLLAFGVRWALKYKHAADKAAAPLAVTHVEEEADAEAGATADDAATAHGPLTFEHDPVEVNPRPEDDEVTTTFSFTNTSGKPVTITGLESTCSCLEASLDQRTYAPGAKGTGKALFKVSSFVGRHEKTLHLQTDDPAAPEQVLTFIIDVPVVVSIEPNFLEWTLGDAPTPKEMTIKMLGDQPINIKNITATRENVRFELTEVTPGREYRLTLTPTATDVITMGGLKIETDSKIFKYSRQMAYFSISRPELVEKRKAAEKGSGEPEKP